MAILSGPDLSKRTLGEWIHEAEICYEKLSSLRENEPTCSKIAEIQEKLKPLKRKIEELEAKEKQFLEGCPAMEEESSLKARLEIDLSAVGIVCRGVEGRNKLIKEAEEMIEKLSGLNAERAGLNYPEQIFEIVEQVLNEKDRETTPLEQ